MPGGIGAGSVRRTLPTPVVDCARTTMVLNGAPTFGALRYARATPFWSVTVWNMPLVDVEQSGVEHRTAPYAVGFTTARIVTTAFGIGRLPDPSRVGAVTVAAIWTTSSPARGERIVCGVQRSFALTEVTEMVG
ncbi:MAG: hypothetical protein EBT22_12475 [Chloroflexi bacterium]|nr:hypothetical protein [Chloroflexota bacterium]